MPPLLQSLKPKDKTYLLLYTNILFWVIFLSFSRSFFLSGCQCFHPRCVTLVDWGFLWPPPPILPGPEPRAWIQSPSPSSHQMQPLEYNHLTLIFSGQCQGQLSGKSFQIPNQKQFKCSLKLYFFTHNHMQTDLIISFVLSLWYDKFWGCGEDLEHRGRLWPGSRQLGSSGARA